MHTTAVVSMSFEGADNCLDLHALGKEAAVAAESLNAEIEGSADFLVASDDPGRSQINLKMSFDYDTNEGFAEAGALLLKILPLIREQITLVPKDLPPANQRDRAFVLFSSPSGRVKIYWGERYELPKQVTHERSNGKQENGAANARKSCIAGK